VDGVLVWNYLNFKEFPLLWFLQHQFTNVAGIVEQELQDELEAELEDLEGAKLEE